MSTPVLSERLAPKVLSVRRLPNADAQLCAQFGLKTTHSLAFITCDQDDSLYAALDHATKMAAVRVVYARSFYAGAAHASGPLSGEAMGVLAAADPDVLDAGVQHCLRALEELFAFFHLGRGCNVFPTVIARCGDYLAQEAKLPVGAPLGYFIAPPVEAMIGMDAALKVANVKLVRFFGPPTETNFAGCYVTGELASVQASATAFAEAVRDVVQHPLR